jgi:BRCT domain type II-containing protein
MGGSEAPENEVQETELSRKQAEIVRSREAFFQEFTLPEIKEHIESVKNTDLRDDFRTESNMPMVANQVSDIRDNFSQQRKNLSNSLAKRGLEGSGVEAYSLGTLGAVEAETVANTVSQGQLQDLLRKDQYIDLKNQTVLNQDQLQRSSINSLLKLAPKPTTAAPMQMMQKPGEQSPWGATISGGMQGAAIGGKTGGPWGAVIGGIVGSGAGYASAT